MELNNKSVVVVGNSGHLKGLGLGSTIDKFDVVIRFNNAQTKGYEDDVGSKFDIWGVFNTEPHPEPWNHKKWLQFHRYFEDMQDTGYSVGEIREIVMPVNELWYLSWKKTDLTTNWKKGRLLRKYGLANRIKRIESVEYSQKCRQDLRTNQSTGINAIWCLSQMLDRFYIVGFSAFGMWKDTHLMHYYDDETVEHWSRTGIPHTPRKEARYLRKLKKQGIITELESGVSEPQKSHLTSSIDSIACELCGKENQKYFWESQSICQYCGGEIE